MPIEAALTASTFPISSPSVEQQSRNGDAPSRPCFPAPSDTAAIACDMERPYVVRYLNCTSNKPLHLGHLRNLVLGDATVGVLQALGGRAVRHCIGEDTGRFMAEAMVAVRLAEARGESIPAPGSKSDHFVGECYARYRKERSATATGSTAEAGTSATTNYDGRNDDADEMMRALLREEPAACALRDRVKRMASTGQQSTLRGLGVAFDYCDFESAEDSRMPDFLVRCRQLGLLQPGEDGSLAWVSPSGDRLRLINKSGFCEESARLLSFNARIAASPAGAFRTIVFAGSEWKASMQLYAEFLDAFGTGLANNYLPTFYGMVLLGGKKMASSTGTGVLVDDLIDEVARDPRIGELTSKCGNRASAADLSVLIVRAFLLSAPRTDPVEFTFERLTDPATNPGWVIAKACAGIPARGISQCSSASRLALDDALARRSYEEPIETLHRLATRFLDLEGSKEQEADFRSVLTAMSLLSKPNRFVFEETPSFLTAQGRC